MIRPWMQFMTRDWLDCKELRRCRPESRAVLADLMCLAHEGERYGYLVDSVGPLTSEYMASRCSISLPKFRRALEDLISNTRIQQDENGFFISRMVRDEDIRKRRAAGGVLGGNPHLKVDEEVNLSANLTGNLPDASKGYPPSPARTRADSDSDSVSDSVESKKQKKLNYKSEVGKWFEEFFWPIWPVKENKAAAKVAAEKIEPEEREGVLCGVRSQSAKIAAMERPIHASTWINNRRWEDDPAAVMLSNVQRKMNGTLFGEPDRHTIARNRVVDAAIIWGEK